MTPASLDKIFAEWKRDHIANSPISRNTEAYNALMPKIDALKQMIEEFIGAPKSASVAKTVETKTKEN